MSSQYARPDSLFSWVDLSSSEQPLWIASYLSRTTEKSLLYNYLTQNLAGLSGEDVSHEIRERIVSTTARDFVSTDLHSRELMRRMRGAWYQKKYRKRTGKQVSFQLPESTASELNRIAKKRELSRTQALEQIINEASGNIRHESEQLRKAEKSFESQVKKLQREKEGGDGARDQVINYLLGELSLELLVSYGGRAPAVHRAIKGFESEEVGKRKPLDEKLSDIDKFVFSRLPTRRGVKSIRSFLPEDYEASLSEDPNVMSPNNFM